jgi:hypothetical protein
MAAHPSMELDRVRVLSQADLRQQTFLFVLSAKAGKGLTIIPTSRNGRAFPYCSLAEDRDLA